MLQGGTLDLVFTPPLRGKGGAYELAPRPKYYVEVEGAAHFAWTDSRANAKEAIVQHALAFLDRHVKGLPAGAPLRAAQSGVAVFRSDPPAR